MTVGVSGIIPFVPMRNEICLEYNQVELLHSTECSYLSLQVHPFFNLRGAMDVH